MEEPTYIHLEETRSTNSDLAGIAADAVHGTVVYADRQTAGRGQRGNYWESEPGKNITFSILLKRGNVHPANQFQLSEICALAVARTLRRYTADITVKWPNDIYYKDKKICGILIEHSLSAGKINYTIAGIGINVNQQKFLSDAPNPVSLALILGHEVPLDEVLHGVADEILEMCDKLPAAAESIHREFLRSLYRRDRFFRYRAMKDSVSVDEAETIEEFQEFMAKIVDVAHDGMLKVQTESGKYHVFAFKEIAFII